MGTRHLVAVMKNKEYKVAQYGQWDGYPSGQGLTVLNFLREANLDKFREQISKCKFIEDEDFYNKAYAELNIDTKDGYVSFEDAEIFASKYPQLSRDIGGKILDFVLNNNDVLLTDSIDFANDSLFCEWAYVVDLDKNLLEVYQGFNSKPLSEDERFFGPKDENGYYPIKHVISFDLNNLPTEEEFLSNFTEE